MFSTKKKFFYFSNEVAQFLNLSIPELQAILTKFNDEEERELEKIRSR